MQNSENIDEKKLDCLFHLILLNDYIPKEFEEFLELKIPPNLLNPNNTNLFSLKIPKIEFLLNLINFYDIIIRLRSQAYNNNNVQNQFQFMQSPEDSYRIKLFFNYCLVDEKCPKLMWLWIVKFFKKLFNDNYDIFKEISNADFKMALDNTYKNQILIEREVNYFISLFQDDPRITSCKNNINIKIEHFVLAFILDSKNVHSINFEKVSKIIKNEIFSCSDFLYHHQFF